MKGMLRKIVSEITLKDIILGEKIRCTGIDSASNGKKLLGIYFTSMTATAVTLRGINDLKPKILIDGGKLNLTRYKNPTRLEALLLQSLKIEIAKKAAAKHKPEVILLNGSLKIPRKLHPNKNDSKTYKKKYKETIRKLKELISKCLNEKIAVAGIIRDGMIKSYMRKTSHIQKHNYIWLNSYLEENLVKGKYVYIKPKTIENSSSIKTTVSYLKTLIEFHPMAIETPIKQKEKLNRKIFSVIWATTEAESGIPWCMELAHLIAKIPNMSTEMIAKEIYTTHQ